MVLCIVSKLQLRRPKKRGSISPATTPPNQPQQCILTHYFNNYNFVKLK